jgi:hypothetical protein
LQPKEDLFMRPCPCLLSVLFCLSISSVLAAPAVFTIDPAQTDITLGGTIAGVPVLEQGTGSLKTKFQGTINVEIAATTIHFTGASVIDAITNGVWQPGSAGAVGSAPADFAGSVSAPIGSVVGAFRNIIVDVTSASLPLAAGGTFDAAQLIFGFPTNSTSVVDFRATPSIPFIPVQTGQRALTGAAANKVTSTGTLSTTAGVQRLVFQVNATFPFTAISANDSSATILGQLVATSGAVVAPPLKIASAAFVASKLEVTVDDTSASLQIQTTSNFVNWSARTATKQTVSGKTVFTVDPIVGGTEFFRVFK